MATLPYDVTPYAASSHQGFVQAAWCKGAKQSWSSLSARLASPDVACVVASVPGDADSLLGWACVDREQGAVVWAYTRELYGRVRGRGLATSLLLALDIDVSEPTPLLYWSPAADAIAARGYPIYHRPEPVLDAIRLLERNGLTVTKRRAA
jgi:hypothetical protein